MTVGLGGISPRVLVAHVLIVLSSMGAVPSAAETLRQPGAPGMIVPIVDRPEMRSFQPYSGLQFDFRPLPPVQRGVRSKRPKVVMPKPVVPLIEYGTATPYSALGYAYCAESPGTFEPRTGPYGSRPIESNQCP